MEEPQVKLIKPFYRPSVESEKRRYWDLKNRQRMRARRQTQTSCISDPNRKPIPDNSEPWLEHPARNLTELIEVFREMEQTARRWGTELTAS